MRKSLLSVMFFAVLVSPRTWADDWKLGTTEMSATVGANGSENWSGAHWSIGTGASVALARFVALQGGYAYHRRYAMEINDWAGNAPISVKGRAAVHELLAGPRLLIPIPGRVTPYLDGYAGTVRQNVGFEVGIGGVRSNEGVGIWKAAFGGGAGAEIRFSRNGSFSVGARGIRPLDSAWYGALMFGVHYRITGWRDAKWRM